MNTILSSIFYTTVMPSVLDGGPQILLANILTPKRLICTYASDMAHPVQLSHGIWPYLSPKIYSLL